MRRLNDAMRERFGKKLYRLSLSVADTCPNRDGTKGTRGCIFCSEGGSGEFASPAFRPVSEQIEEAKEKVRSKLGSGPHGYIAYFQSYTGTYVPYERMRKCFHEAITADGVEVLSVATRPDCLPDETVYLLKELSNIKPVWVELGLQTVHERTADYIRRGYPLPVYDDAVRRLKAAGLEVIVHVILGLPGESAEDMEETVRYVASSGADGIKLQLLHVLEGTDLAEEWRAGRVPVMSLPEYAELLVRLLKLLPDHVVVHRMTGDGPKRLLLAPLWSADKKRVLNYVNRVILEAGL